ncbi:holliday junction resolvase [Wolffia australiana]
MEDEQKRKKMTNLVEAIKSAENGDVRLSLLDQLEDLDSSEASELVPLMEGLSSWHLATLTRFWEVWEDSVCLDVSQCMLNRKILNVALKQLGMNASACLNQCVDIGTKASMWCRKHLEVTSISGDQGVEEHSATLTPLVLDSLQFSSATILALTEYIYFGERTSIPAVENFILEQFILTRTLISDVKRFQLISMDLVKAAQAILDSTVKLCRWYFESMHLNNSDMMIGTENGADDVLKAHIITLTALTIENLHELGILAASGGGSLVTILNVSWKGVVSLLQLGKKVLAGRVKIVNILCSLITLADGSLCRSSEAWLSSQKTELTLSEAKRTFLPVKFYLINAVRISSEHPLEAIKISPEIIKCIMLVSYFGITFAREAHLKAACEALADLLEPTSFLLLHGILNSDEVSSASKSQILEGIFTNKIDLAPAAANQSLTLNRVMIFLSILKSSVSFKEEVISLIIMNLGKLLKSLAAEDVYPFMLLLHVPELCNKEKNKGRISWRPLLHLLFHSLKVFMIAAKPSSSSSVGNWQEVEDFLLHNLFHPHSLCQEIVLEMWRFIMRHVDPVIANQICDRWLGLLKVLASSETALGPFSPLRKSARLMSRILSHAPQPTVDHVYTSLFDSAESDLSSSVYTVRVAMMMEDFPLNFLSDRIQKLSAQRILTDFQRFVANYGNRQDQGHASLGLLPLHSVACALRSSLIAEVDMAIPELLKFSLQLVQDQKKGNHGSGHLLSPAMAIISRLYQPYHHRDMEDLIKALPTVSLSSELKPALATFMAGLCRTEMREKEDDPASASAWALSHILLRERNWAFLHLSLDGFGYFAARTSCTQLWRFVPLDAALAYDLETGENPSEERFMSALKAFLERESGGGDGIQALRREAAGLLKRLPGEETGGKRKKREIPEEVILGISAVRNGFDLLLKGLSREDGVDLREQLASQLSALREVVVALSGVS